MRANDTGDTCWGWRIGEAHFALSNLALTCTTKRISGHESAYASAATTRVRAPSDAHVA
jgi:hypothetical protein